jgi:hypothetical protein
VRLSIPAIAGLALLSFTNITKLDDEAISRAAPPNPPIGPYPLLKLVTETRVLKMASKKVTTTFAVRNRNSFTTLSANTPLSQPTTAFLAAY